MIERMGVLLLTGMLCGHAVMTLVFTVLEFNAFSILLSMVASTMLAMSFVQWFD